MNPYVLPVVIFGTLVQVLFNWDKLFREAEAVLICLEAFRSNAVDIVYLFTNCSRGPDLERGRAGLVLCDVRQQLRMAPVE